MKSEPEWARILAKCEVFFQLNISEYAYCWLVYLSEKYHESKTLILTEKKKKVKKMKKICQTWKEHLQINQLFPFSRNWVLAWRKKNEYSLKTFLKQFLISSYSATRRFLSSSSSIPKPKILWSRDYNSTS